MKERQRGNSTSGLEGLLRRLSVNTTAKHNTVAVVMDLKGRYSSTSNLNTLSYTSWRREKVINFDFCDLIITSRWVSSAFNVVISFLVAAEVLQNYAYYFTSNRL